MLGQNSYIINNYQPIITFSNYQYRTGINWKSHEIPIICSSIGGKKSSTLTLVTTLSQLKKNLRTQIEIKNIKDCWYF